MYKLYRKTGPDQKTCLNIYVGTVKGEPKKHVRGDMVIMSVTLQDYTGEIMTVYFRNGDNKRTMLADRIVNAGVKDGTFMAVRAVSSDEEEKSATAIDFKIGFGAWELKDAEPAITVVIGKPYRMKKLTPSAPNTTWTEGLQFTMRLPQRDGNTEWLTVSFYDDEKHKNATFANKVLYNADQSFIAVLGGAIRTSEYNGKCYRNLTGWRVTKQNPEDAPQTSA